MQIVEYAKAHPWATGIVVVIGGIIFISITGIASGDGSGGTDSGPSDAEIAANATIAAAQIAMQGQQAQAGAAVSAAQIGAGVQLNSDNKAAEVAMRQIEAQERLGLDQIGAQKDIIMGQVNSVTAQQQAIISALPTLKKKNRDDVLKSLVTGEYGYQGGPGPGTITQIGQAAGGIASAITSIGGLFSDQRLKENIRHIGHDAKGRNLYEYNYKGSNKLRTGYIAQDLLRSHPEMVHKDERTGMLQIGFS